MKLYQKSILTTACALALTACGGGSDVQVVHSPAASTASTSQAAAPTNSTKPNTTTGNAATPANGTKPDTKPDTKPNTGSASNTAATPTPSKSALGVVAASEKGMQNMKQDIFNGALVSINNQTGAVVGSQTPNLNFENFKIGNARVLLLQNVYDKTNGVSIRALNSNDFPDGNFSPKDSANAGYVGSSFDGSDGTSLDSFGRLRYGVYTDSTNTSHLFVHGNPTDRIFKGTFLGSAVIGKDGNYRALDKAVKAVVDNDLTRVDVTIKTDKTTLNFGGAINQEAKTFAGTKNGVNTRGGFFGKDGLGGFFEVSEGVHQGEHGVYGASSGPNVAEAYR